MLAGAATAAARRNLLAWMEETRIIGDYRRVVLCDARGSVRLALPEGSGAGARPGRPPAAPAPRRLGAARFAGRLWRRRLPGRPAGRLGRPECGHHGPASGPQRPAWSGEHH